MLPVMSDVTHILSRIESGDAAAAEQLLPLVYAELRELASARLAGERPGHTLQPTALVHEAYLRLVDQERAQQWNNRGHFFGAAAEAMRRILVENARRKQRLKHGGDMNRIDLDRAGATPTGSDELTLAVDDCLEALGEQNSQAAQLVRLRYFAGLTMREVADVMGIAPRTADRLWAYAKAWLHAELAG